MRPPPRVSVTYFSASTHIYIYIYESTCRGGRDFTNTGGVHAHNYTACYVFTLIAFDNFID